MSSFTWLDYAESDRQAAMDVIDLFREQETRDELGIGTVRDTFSDLLFPGTSAIQTRARYFFIVPWIYLYHEKRKAESAEIAQKAKRDEIGMIEVLESSEDSVGTIGIRARKSLKRLPSMVYWQGLGRLGIRTYPGGRDQYHRSLDRFYLRLGGTVRNDDGEVVQGVRTRNWDKALPPAPPTFPKVCSLALTTKEAAYLRDRIIDVAPKSLFAYLVDSEQETLEVEFPWEHPDAAEFPADAANVVVHARNFSESLHGASLLYNLILAELLKKAEDIDDYRNRLQQWSEQIAAALPRLQAWDLDQFWLVVATGQGRIPIPTRNFVNAWLAIARSGAASGVADSATARTLIKNRERELKRGLARVDGGRALELWGGAAGTRQMDYRWTATARGMIQDIHEGLNRDDA